MKIVYQLVDGTIATIENVREFTYAYEVPYYSVWFVDENGRMKKITIMTEIVEWIELERRNNG